MLHRIIADEVRFFTTQKQELSPGHSFSQYSLVKQIALFANNVYESGKIDSQGNYKYYYDIITPAIDAETKNIDFDTNSVTLAPDNPDNQTDATLAFLANSFTREWLRNTGQGVKLNEAIEESTGWGNVVWKKAPGGYERMDLLNFYVINQAARSLNDTPVIERHILTARQLRGKIGIWDKKAVEELLDSPQYQYTSAKDGSINTKTGVAYYELFERNGEVSLYDLKTCQGKEATDADKNKYVLGKVIVGGVSTNSPETGGIYLYAEQMDEMPYKEYHRGRYAGRWFRVGFYEMLFDFQIRANDIGNQIARALEFSSKQVFQSPDQLIVKNILTDLQRGDIVQTQSLGRVDMNMHDLNHFITEWNQLLGQVRALTNANEAVTGETMPSGTPFRLGAMLNQNSNKLYDFIREKLALAFGEVVQDWILPMILDDLKAQDVLRITGDQAYQERFLRLLVDAWYTKNIAYLPPHGPEQAVAIRDMKLKELQQNPNKSWQVKLTKELWADFMPRVNVVITGENVNLGAEMETYATFASLEADPVRRTALIERAMLRKGIDVAQLPKSDPDAFRKVDGMAEKKMVEPAEQRAGGNPAG